MGLNNLRPLLLNSLNAAIKAVSSKEHVVITAPQRAHESTANLCICYFVVGQPLCAFLLQVAVAQMFVRVFVLEFLRQLQVEPLPRALSDMETTAQEVAPHWCTAPSQRQQHAGQFL